MIVYGSGMPMATAMRIMTCLFFWPGAVVEH